VKLAAFFLCFELWETSLLTKKSFIFTDAFSYNQIESFVLQEKTKYII